MMGYVVPTLHSNIKRRSWSVPAYLIPFYFVPGLLGHYGGWWGDFNHECGPHALYFGWRRIFHGCLLLLL